MSHSRCPNRALKVIRIMLAAICVCLAQKKYLKYIWVTPIPKEKSVVFGRGFTVRGKAA